LLHYKLRTYPVGLSSALHKSARMWLKPVKRAAAIACTAFSAVAPDWELAGIGILLRSCN